MIDNPKSRFVATFSSALVVTLFMLYLIGTSQIAMGVLPATGIGGVFLRVDTFEGEGAVAYPERGDIQGLDGGVTNSPGCKSMPTLAIRLTDSEDGQHEEFPASLQGYEIYKDVKIPFFDEQWLSVEINEPTSIRGEQITIYTTQLYADTLNIKNIALSEGASNNKFGPQSGEFRLKADPEGTVNESDGPALTATGVKGWVHAIVGEQIVFEGNTSEPIEINTSFRSTAEIQTRYDNIGILGNNRGGADASRTNYFDCLPGGVPDVEPDDFEPSLDNVITNERFYDEDTNTATIPANWNTSGEVSPTSSYGNEPDGDETGVDLGADGSTLTSPTEDLSREFQVTLTYYYYRYTGVESGEFLYVEYRGENGDWKLIDTIEGVESSTSDEGLRGVDLPEGAFHEDFAVRFRSIGSSSSWIIDDVTIGTQ
jgi:hypothetical protein